MLNYSLQYHYQLVVYPTEYPKSRSCLSNTWPPCCSSALHTLPGRYGTHEPIHQSQHQHPSKTISMSCNVGLTVWRPFSCWTWWHPKSKSHGFMFMVFVGNWSPLEVKLAVNIAREEGLQHRPCPTTSAEAPGGGVSRFAKPKPCANVAANSSTMAVFFSGLSQLLNLVDNVSLLLSGQLRFSY